MTEEAAAKAQEDYLQYIKIYQPKDEIVREGDTDDDFFCLLQGQLGIWKGDVKVGSIQEKGTYFGEMSYLLSEPRSATIKAEGVVKCLRFPGSLLPQLSKRQPDLSWKLLRSIADRLKGTTQQTRNVSMQRNELREDATEQLQHAQNAFKRLFILMTSVQSQFPNQYLKDVIALCSQEKLLQGKRMRVDKALLETLPPKLRAIVEKAYPEE